MLMWLWTQNHANDNYRRVVELIESGAIGKVLEAHVWNSWAGAGMLASRRLAMPMIVIL